MRTGIGAHISLTLRLTRYAHRYQCAYLVNIPQPVQYQKYTLAFPFDLRCESVTYMYVITQDDNCYNIAIYAYVRIRM